MQISRTALAASTILKPSATIPRRCRGSSMRRSRSVAGWLRSRRATPVARGVGRWSDPGDRLARGPGVAVAWTWRRTGTLPRHAGAGNTGGNRPVSGWRACRPARPSGTGRQVAYPPVRTNHRSERCKDCLVEASRCLSGCGIRSAASQGSDADDDWAIVWYGMTMASVVSRWDRTTSPRGLFSRWTFGRDRRPMIGGGTATVPPLFPP